MLAPELGPLGQRDEREIYDERGEVVGVAREVCDVARRMLVVLVSDLARPEAFERGHVHAVEVNEPQLSPLDDDVSVLQVSVRDLRFGERGDELEPLVGKVRKSFAATHGLVEVNVERRPFDPLHDEHGIASARDEYPLRQILEARERIDAVSFEVRVERAVAFGAVAEVASEAAHSQRHTRLAVELEDVRELAGRYERHA